MSTLGAPPRVMLVGCGAIAERGILPALTRMGVIPAVLADANLARAEALAAQFRVARAISDYRSALRDVDAAAVAVPHALHASVCSDLLGHGIHVFVEKPMALTTSECATLIAAAEERKLALAVGLMRRYRHSALWMKAALSSGVLGPPHSVDVREGFEYSWPAASDSFFRRDSAGGGVLLDTGSHTIDLLLWWLGDASVVSYRDDEHGGVEAECVLELAFASGCRGRVELSRTRRLRNSAVFRWRHSAIEVPLHHNELTARPRRLLQRKPDGRPGNELPPQDIGDLVTLELGDWLRAIAEGGDVQVDGTEGARAIAVIEQCYARRRPLELPWVSVGPGVERSVSPSSSAGGRVLVTGATGFIGGRLVERIGFAGERPISAFVRSYGGAARIARFPVRLLQGTLDDAAALDGAVAGCDVVFHCAHDFSSEEANVTAAEALAVACRRHGVRRLVYLSSFSVYEPLPDGDVVETSRWPASEQPYVCAKRRCETLLLDRAQREGLPVVVLQPTVVYGPFCRPWTISPVRLMREGRIVLPDGGEGLCNAVYVDDLVDAMLLAAEVPDIEGERFLISGERPVSWREFYGAFEQMLAVRGVALLSPLEIERLRNQGDTEVDLRAVSHDPRRVTRWRAARLAADLARAAMGNKHWERLKRFTPTPLHLPVGPRLDLYRARAWVRIDKAHSRLGFAPARDLQRGMELTTEYVRWAGL